MFYAELSNNIESAYAAEEKWGNIPDYERKVLRWLATLPDLDRKIVDKTGSAVHGPYRYHQALCRLIQSECIYLLKTKGAEYYCIPRELDHYIFNQFFSWEKPSANTVYFDITSFLFNFLLFVSRRIGSENKRSPVNNGGLIFNEFDSVFSEELKEISRDPGKLIQYLRFGPDSIAEHFAGIYLREKAVKKDMNVKHLLYGNEVPASLFSSRGELTELPFFTSVMPEAALHMFRNYFDSSAKGIPLPDNEWLFPLNTEPSHLFILLTFSDLVSTGQMLHIKFTESSIKEGERVFTDPSPFWNEILSSFAYDKAVLDELERLAKKNASVVNKGSFVYFKINSSSMRNTLMKKAVMNVGKEFVIQAEEGIFIAAEKAAVWEEYLEQEDISFTCDRIEEAAERKELEKPFTAGKYEDVQLDEWKGARRIPEASFKLTSYRENMKARMIRQSQALKLPVIIELSDGSQIVEEVKTLKYQTEEAGIETYSGRSLSLAHIQRLAITHPGSEETGENLRSN
ncbi:hypothetical protein [Evansella clarkii]|uniref:hypothetical protein n=1 Tax=Evansella clarkii TaxID=79879 RepID=UPI001066250E|nr:hypothetical protein [Evansella clarkii]